MSACDCYVREYLDYPGSYRYFKYDDDYETAHDAEDAYVVNPAWAASITMGQLWVKDDPVLGAENQIIVRLALVCHDIPSGLRFGNDGPVISAYLALWGQDKKVDAAFDVVIVAVDPTTFSLGSSMYEVARYGELLDKVTSFGKVSSSAFDLGEYNNVLIEQDGLTYINDWLANYHGRSYIILGVRSSRDISETAPTENGDFEEYVTIITTNVSFLHLLYLDAEPSEDIIVSTDPPTEVLPTTANLNGTLTDDAGEACQCGFKWGDTEDCDDEITDTEEKETSETFQQSISGLTPGTRYYYKAFAVNSEGTGYGKVRTFRAPLEFPSDSMARVSSIRRVYRPGSYRMEMSLGSLGADIDIADTGVKKIVEEVKEPKEPEKVEEPEEAFAGAEARGRRQGELVTFNQDAYNAMFPPTPVVSTKTTAPAPQPTLQQSWVDRPILDLAVSAIKTIAETHPIAIIIRGIRALIGLFR